MAEQVVIDPLTRIEGHLRIEMETDAKKIKKAWSVSTQFRGLELIVRDRDPRDVWAFVQRTCGVCTSVHAIASVLAVENAIGSQVPEAAKLIRHLVLGSQEIQDHVIHFYHLHALDFVNVANAAKADPQKALDFANSIGSKWRRAGIRAAVGFHRRVLGSPRLSAAPRGGPDGGRALSGRLGIPAFYYSRQHSFRWQEPPPELPGGRDGLFD